MMLMDGEIRDGRHWKGHIVRACREGDKVRVSNVYSWEPWLIEELDYDEFVRRTEDAGGLVEAFA